MHIVALASGPLDWVIGGGGGGENGHGRGQEATRGKVSEIG